jgi:hypothetical protein
MVKKTTLKEIGEMLTHVVKHMATKDEIKDMVTKDDIRTIVRAELAEYATKSDVRTILRDETKGIREEFSSMRRDLDQISDTLDNLNGLPKEIDHALDRIAAIEKHPAISKRSP